MKCADEIREIAEAHLERDVGDRPGFVGEQARRAAEPRAHEVADYPRIDKRMVRVGMSVSIYGIDDAGAMGPFPRVGER